MWRPRSSVSMELSPQYRGYRTQLILIPQLSRRVPSNYVVMNVKDEEDLGYAKEEKNAVEIETES